MATVRERIRARGRTYEQRISEEYLGQLQERYLDHLRTVSYTHLRAHETVLDLVCRLLLEKKKKKKNNK